MTRASENTVETALSAFGLSARSVAPLGSYHDACYTVETSAGRFVLKISPPEQDEAIIALETSVVDRILAAEPDLPLPAYRRSASDLPYAAVEVNGSPRYARVLDFVDGLHYADLRPRTRQLRESLGHLLARLDRALLDFSHPAQDRYFEWDLAHAGDAAKLTGTIADDERRRGIEAIFRTHAEKVVPQLGRVRKSVVHSDANDYNLLVNIDPSGKTRIAALLDFGDVVQTHLINELAIACAYVMMDEGDPIAAASDVVRSYNRDLPLTEAEIEILYPLALTRLAMSATFSARWRSLNPEGAGDEYHTISEKAVWALLDALEDVHPRFATYAFRHACGLAPCALSLAVASFLKSHAPATPLTALDPRTTPTHTIDLSAGSSDPAAREIEADPITWSRAVREQIDASGAEVGIGRYDEARACYSSSQFQKGDSEPRTVHLGIDLFAPAGAAVQAPLDGTVHSLGDNRLPLDYGPTVILEHALPDGQPFFSLYGHLSRTTLRDLEPGRRIAAGEPFGTLGDPKENGGWPPHLHFQIITDLLDHEGDFSGVCRAGERAIWNSLCPDPNTLIGLPAGRTDSCMDSATVLKKRSRFIGPNLSLAYRAPLHIVRGRGAYLFDVNGHRFLDCVNNVAHVGHSHPRVVEAIASQAAVLNTNTRYLHENIVRYAERLSATLPDPLRVCFFVNSGSEANDLALRMARAHTGGVDCLVLGSAYHGHLTNLIDVSPYKSRGPGGAGAPSYVHELSAPDTFRGPHADADDPPAAYASEAAAALRDLDGRRRLAAFIAESALSCAGQILLPDGYLKSVYQSVRDAGGVCIADEVQVGFGRIGSHFWVFESQGVVPDIVTMGKPIGNGHPIGAVVTTPEIAASFANGMEYFNTYGGNPVSCAAGVAVLDVIRDEGLQEQASQVGAHLLSDLRSLADSHSVIGDVRGRGLFIGIELVIPGTRRPASRIADYVINRLRETGVLMSTDGPDHNVLKFKPPMVFGDIESRTLLRRLEAVLKETFVASFSAG